MFDFKIDIHELKNFEKILVKLHGGVAKAPEKAIGPTLDVAKVAVTNHIQKTYMIASNDIPDKIERWPFGDAVVIEPGMLGLEKFTGGTTAIVKKGGGGVIPGAFVRGGVIYHRTTRKRYPIRRLMTIGAPIMATQPGVGDAANKEIGTELDARMNRELSAAMEAAG